MSGTSVTSDRALALEAGRQLACAPPGEEVVISGIAGFFPDSDNVADFADKLFNKVDLISDDDRRWKLEHPEIPQRTGKLNEVSKFDAAFFGVHFKQAHTMDPMCRMLLEKAYEAIVDSGYNPRHLRGTRTGVFVGACFSESEKTWFYEKLQVNGFGITGCSRAMLANRISYWLGINGPSYTVDSACSSSLYALEHAYKSIRDGHCDAAIVGGCNLCLHPYVSLQFARLGVLSQDGRCKCFDEAANGYCRSEAVAIVYLQKAKDARRVYATVVHAKTNCDGYKEQGITFPSGPLQQRLLEEFYEECQISPSSLAWVEAHGTGTRVGDPEEVKALENVFCAGRTTPLPIGSVKSNIGHSEPASGLCSITKVLIAMESGFIPPNINFKNPRKDIDAFFNGKINVVTEKTAWDGGMVGINSFGFGGANCHVLLKWNEKSKKNGGAPDDDIPRVVPASGRTENAVDVILSDVESRGLDIEFVKLLHEVHADEIPGHIYRGYTVMTKNNSSRMRSIKYYPGDKRPVWFIFSGMGSQWAGMGATLMKIPVFASAIQLCHQTLAPKGVDLIRIISDPDPKIFDNILNSFVGIAAIQIGLVDVLTTIGIVPDHLIGHSVGELGCAYADGCFTAQQMILAAYYRGLASLQSQLIPGAMAAVGMGYNDIRDMVPAEIDVACHNSAGSCTISGPAAIIRTFVKRLQDQKIFAREVNVSNIAYHSRYIAPAGPKLLAYLKQVVPKPKPRSAKWVSSSVPQAQLDSPQAKLCSAEYHTNNLLNPVLFEEASRQIQTRAIAIEIAPHGLLQAILRRSLDKQTTNIPLTQKDSSDNSVVLMSALGKLYEAGLMPQFAALYPEVPLPVSRGTPMIAPLVRWEHSEDWYVTSYRMQEKIKSGERTVNINLKDDELEYLGGHVIDGRNLYPATGYLALAWETVGLMRGELYTDVPVVFEDVRFHRATNLPKDGSVDFIVMVQKGSGNFEIVEGGAAIVTGKIYVPENISKEVITLDPPEEEEDPSLLDMSGKDFYKELRLRGYNYKGLFRSVTKANNTGTIGQVAWHNNWVAFMDNLLQMQIIREDTRGLFVPTSIQKLVIDVKKHVHILFSLPDEGKEVPVYVYNYLDLIKCGGVQIEGLKASAISRRKPMGEPVLEKYQFFPHISENKDIDLSTFTRMCVHLALDNILVTKVKCVELLEGSDPDSELLSPSILLILGDLPLLQAEISVLSPADNPKVADLGSNIAVEDKKLPSDQSAILVVASNLFNPSRAEVLKSCLGAIREDGYILTREKINEKFDFTGYSVCMERTIESEKLILFKKSQEVKGERMVINIPVDDYSWVPQVQAAFKSDTVSRVLLYAEKEPTNGIIGLVNCLRKEPGSEKTSCVFILDPKAPAFSTDCELYKAQLAKNLAVNVFKDGVWGSFRHFPIEVLTHTEVDHAFVNTTVRGDLSSLSWLQGPLAFNEVVPKEKELVHIYYSALNFRDVMMMTGKLAPEVITRDRREQDCMCGFEFAGLTSKGRRVMGMTSCRCLSNTVVADPMLMWDVPDEWTLEQAASVPVVYGTAIFALYTCGNMKRGDSVLIHAGTGGVGQAAIYLALHEGCIVFTTVGTQEKREFIKKTFPQIKDSHIGNSRDCSFETMIMTETDGCGVDLVLNSLAEEKLLASVRCLARNGRFLEIGKFDLANNNPLGMETFLRETSFHGIQLDTLFVTPQSSRKLELQDMVTDSIKSGAVKPLCTTVFKEDQVEQAFRYMASGKHVGKVLVQIRDDDSQTSSQPKPVKMLAKNRFFCKNDASYIIIGGLGGFGLELADWLALRGCKKLVLTSRSGLRSGYQAMRIRIWKSYGIDVQISTVDVTTEQGVRELLKQANSLAPVGGIFNLAVVLKDSLFENQTPADFEASAGPKAVATKLLDKLSRKMCPSLTHFVIFSSVSCGRGNAGQTNYGLSNSVMERVCEQRQEDGLPALAVQWGAVGEVGLVADMQEDNLEVVIGGTLQQRINSCLEVLDGFMFCPYPVVASMVVAEKRAGGGVAGNIVDTVVNILGLRDLKTISLHSTLAELGMDSMMAVEIKQTLEREFQVFLTPQDIRGMTFAKLQDLAAQTENESNTGAPKVSENVPDFGINHLLRVVGDEMLSGEPILRLPSLCGDGKTIEEISSNDDLIFLIPGVEGVGSVVEPLAKNLKAQALCLQFDFEKTYDTIGDIAESLLPHIKKRLRPGANFKLMGYSFGAMVALEIVHRLEAEGRRGHIWLIDGAPDFLQGLSRKTMHAEDEKDGFQTLQIQLIHRFMDLIWPQDKASFESELLALPDWDARVEYLVKMAPEGIHSRRAAPRETLPMPNSECVLDQDDMEKSSTSSKPESPGDRSVWSSDQDLMAHPRMRAHLPRSGQRLKRPASRGRLKWCIAFLLFTTACLFTACAFLLYSYIENILMQKETCTTPECIRAASLIMTTMDTSADPCEDFYQFACGNFQREHPIPDTDFSEDWFTNRNHHAIHRVREYLEKNDTDDEPGSVHKARVMYRACNDIESLERLSLSPMIRFLEHLGLPASPPLDAFQDQDQVSWLEAIAHVKRHIDKDILVGFDVMADPVNNTRNRLSFGMPGDSSILPSHNEHSKVRRPSLRWLLARGDRRKKMAWHEYIVKTMNYILEYNNMTTAPLNASVQAAVTKIIQFEKKLIMLKDNFTSTDPAKDDLPRNLWVAELQKLTDKEVSSYASSQISWRKYIEVLFDGVDEVNLDLVDVDMLAVYNLDYILALVKLLADTPDDTILLTVWWEVVFELAPHTSNDMRDLRTDFEEKTIGEVAPTSRPTHCAYVVYKLLDVAVGTVDTKESFLNSTKPKVNEMIDFIQESFIKAVDSTTWIDKKTKAAIKEKVNYIKRRIGFPEWMLDESEVDEYYDTLEMYEKTHLENMLTYLGRSVYSNFKDIHQYNVYNSTGFNPLEVNAAYSVTDNMIYVPLGMIQYPFFNLGLDVLNYGAIGSILGHELVHSLDTDGRRYDKTGNFRSWWTNQSINAFSERVSCLVDKYSNYYIEDVDDWVDGNLTLGENIADNGGLRAALWGYHRRVARHGAEPALPGLAGYTHDQLFFLAFANMWCENWSRQAMRWTLEGEHAPNYVRVMGTLSNSPDFGRAWHCPNDAEMNPTHKCQVW